MNKNILSIFQIDFFPAHMSRAQFARPYIAYFIICKGCVVFHDLTCFMLVCIEILSVGCFTEEATRNSLIDVPSNTCGNVYAE